MLGVLIFGMRPQRNALKTSLLMDICTKEDRMVIFSEVSIFVCSVVSFLYLQCYSLLVIVVCIFDKERGNVVIIENGNQMA